MARTLVGTGALLLAVFAAVPDVGIGQQTSSSMPRTPWGDPDIQGVFTTDDELGVPFERPISSAHRTVYLQPSVDGGTAPKGPGRNKVAKSGASRRPPGKARGARIPGVC